MIPVLMDASAYRAMRDNHPLIVEKMQRADKIIVCPIVAGEILFGFHKGTRYSQNNVEWVSFLRSSGVELMVIDEETAARYAIIRHYLHQSGQPVSPNDLWIAACAMQRGAHVLTLDRDFLKIPQIVVDYFEPL